MASALISGEGTAGPASNWHWSGNVELDRFRAAGVQDFMPAKSAQRIDIGGG
jgi:hypothetical protein